MKSIKVVLLSIIITPGVPTAQSQIIIIQIPIAVLPPSPMMKVASAAISARIVLICYRI